MKKITLPLSPTDMVEFFKAKDDHYIIDVKGSLENLNERALLLYLANLKIKCDVDLITEELLLQYMLLKEFCYINNLVKTHANVLYVVKYGELIYPEYTTQFNLKQIVKFVEINPEVLADQCMFLDSMPLYCLTRTKTEEDEEGEIPEVGFVEEGLVDNLGYNVFILCQHEDFLIRFLAEFPAIEDQTYYTRYFDEYIFHGKNLFHYMQDSAFMGMIACILSEDDEESKNILQRMDALTKDVELTADDNIVAELDHDVA